MREEFSRRNVYGDLNINRKGRKDREAAIRLVMHQMLAKNRIDRRRRMSERLNITFWSVKTECERVNRDCTACNRIIKNVCDKLCDKEGYLIAPMFWSESESKISTDDFHEKMHGIGVDEE